MPLPTVDRLPKVEFTAGEPFPRDLEQPKILVQASNPQVVLAVVMSGRAVETLGGPHAFPSFVKIPYHHRADVFDAIPPYGLLELYGKNSSLFLTRIVPYTVRRLGRPALDR